MRAEVTALFANAPRLRELTYQEFILEEGPCWSSRGGEPFLRSLWRGSRHAKVSNIVESWFDIGGITADEVLWVALRPAWYAAPITVLRWLAADFAAAVLPIFMAARPYDQRPRHAIEAARKNALGLITFSDLSVMGTAARNAAIDAVGTEANPAAWAAAWACSSDGVAMGAGEWTGAWTEAWGQSDAERAAHDAASGTAWDTAYAAARAKSRAKSQEDVCGAKWEQARLDQINYLTEWLS